VPRCEGRRRPDDAHAPDAGIVRVRRCASRGVKGERAQPDSGCEKQREHDGDNAERERLGVDAEDLRARLAVSGLDMLRRRLRAFGAVLGVLPAGGCFCRLDPLAVVLGREARLVGVETVRQESQVSWNGLGTQRWRLTANRRPFSTRRSAETSPIREQRRLTASAHAHFASRRSPVRSRYAPSQKALETTSFCPQGSWPPSDRGGDEPTRSSGAHR
jgi:hypothetical protein